MNAGSTLVQSLDSGEVQSGWKERARPKLKEIGADKYIVMPREFAYAWLSALNDPRNPQGTGQLFNGKGYCCLGIMQCAITRGKVEASSHADTKTGKRIINTDKEGFPDFLSLPTRKWLDAHGIRFYGKNSRGNKVLTTNPHLPMFNRSASDANDDMGKKFKDIAEAIRKALVTY
jgi:hypothetical protein